eukprot:COSAG02_NODE_1371_length_13018_cov_6.783265_7_plen_86_part_00
MLFFIARTPGSMLAKNPIFDAVGTRLRTQRPQAAEGKLESGWRHATGYSSLGRALVIACTIAGVVLVLGGGQISNFLSELARSFD